jgi:dCTP deaminase
MIANGSLLTSRSHPPIIGMETQKLRDHGVSYGLGEAGYDIRLKQDILYLPSENLVSLRDGPNHYKESPGRFVLASAIEEFDMPLDLVGVVHDKSTWARQGVSVFNTVIEPGWKGFLTLEIVFHGSERVRIPAGAGIAQVLFHYLVEPAQYNGKYQNQTDKPVESKWEK